ALPPGDAHLLANAPSKQELVHAFSSLPQLGHTHFVTAIHLPTPPTDYPTFIQNAPDLYLIPTLAY
ncbi:MAG: hypothetical protein KDK65_06955, partial [Chlamydiia bacterium]|nr:hypothetical protein [Chlamydiia bacterium]